MIALALLLQAATPVETDPDIALFARVRARSVTIEKQGDARLTVTTAPEGDNLVDVQSPKANGRKTLRDVGVDVRAEARIAHPSL